MTNPAVVQEASYSGNTNTSASLPGAPTPGNTGILSVYTHSSGTTANLDTPSGWTLVSSIDADNFEFAERHLFVYKRTFQSGDSATVPITLASISWNGYWHIAEWSGLVAVGAVDATYVEDYAPGFGGATETATITSTNPGDPVAVHAFGFSLDADTPDTTSMAWTGDVTEADEADAGAGGLVGVARKIDAEAEESYTATLSGTGAHTVGQAAMTAIILVELLGETTPPVPEIVFTINGVEFRDLIEKTIRVEYNGCGSGAFRISRFHEDATNANLARGNIVQVTIPEIHDEILFEWILEDGDFDLVAKDEGSEELSFSGPGTLAILRRAIVHPIPEYDTGDAPASVAKPVEGQWRWVNQEAGDILERIIEEAEARGVLIGTTHTFTDTEDSDSVTWTPMGAWEAPIGANLYDEAMRLVAAGQLVIEMRPGLVLDAWESHGVDRSGTSFGAGVVRFAKAVNITDEVGRQMPGGTFFSRVVVRKSDGTYIERTLGGSPPYEAEGYIEVSSSATAVAEAAGDAALGANSDEQEAIIFGHLIPYPGDETDEDAGIYLPGPTWSDRGLYWIGDLVTLYTGTDPFDYDNETLRVVAITLTENEVGYLSPPIVELGAPWGAVGGEDEATGGAGSSDGSSGGGSGGSGGGSVNLAPYQIRDDDKWKQPVRVATTASITIATGLNVGDTIDGVVLASGDRVLVKDQSAASQNGIYEAGATPVRASDFDGDAEVLGAVVLVLDGTAGAGTMWRVENTTTPDVGTDDITFAEAGGGPGGGSALEVLDEAVSLDSAVESIAFTGTGVVATAVGHDITVEINGATGFIGATAYKTSDQLNLTASTETKVTWDAASKDTDSFFDNANDRLTIPAGMGGAYLVSGVLSLAGYAATPSNDAQGFLRISGDTARERYFFREALNNSGGETDTSFAIQVELVPGDYVEMFANPGSRSDVDVRSTVEYTHLSLVKLDSGKVGRGIGVALTKSAVQSIATGSTVTAVTFDGEDFDSDGFHESVTNPSRVTIPAGLGGIYLLAGSAEFASLGDQKNAIIRFRKNGTTNYQGRARSESSGSGFVAVSHAIAVSLVPGDYVEMTVEHNFGSNRDVRATADGTSFSAMRLDSGSGSTGVRFPTVIQKAQSYAATGGTTATVAIAAAAAGQRIILGAWTTVGDISSVSCTNVTWTKVRDGNFSTTIFADIWVGVVAGGSSGTTITVTKASSGGFAAIAVAVVGDVLTPTVVASALASGTNVQNLGLTRATVTPTAVGTLFAAFGSIHDGTEVLGLMVNQPHHTVYAHTYPLIIGYVSNVGDLSVWAMGGTLNADFAVGIALIT